MKPPQRWFIDLRLMTWSEALSTHTRTVGFNANRVLLKSDAIPYGVDNLLLKMLQCMSCKWHYVKKKRKEEDKNTPEISTLIMMGTANYCSEITFEFTLANCQGDQMCFVLFTGDIPLFNTDNNSINKRKKDVFFSSQPCKDILVCGKNQVLRFMPSLSTQRR